MLTKPNLIQLKLIRPNLKLTKLTSKLLSKNLRVKSARINHTN